MQREGKGKDRREEGGRRKEAEPGGQVHAERRVAGKVIPTFEFFLCKSRKIFAF